MIKRDDNAPERSAPVYVRALDAFREFYMQLGVLDVRTSDFAVALDHGDPSSVVLAAGELDCAWSVLDARMHLLELVTTNDEGRDFWTLPAIERATTRMRPLIRTGAVYLAHHGLDAAQLLPQLRRLQSRLEVQDRLIEQARGSPSTPTMDAELMQSGAEPEPSMTTAICLEARRARRRGRCIPPPSEIRRYARKNQNGRPRRRPPS